MFRKPLNKKLQSFRSSLVQCELSDREQERICGGQNSRPPKEPVEGCLAWSIRFGDVTRHPPKSP
jgi:hypothetical protein